MKGDEGRSVTAKSVGEVSSNFLSGDIRMGKPYRANLDNRAHKKEMVRPKIERRLRALFMCSERTQGSKTFQYLEEKKTIIG